MPLIHHSVTSRHTPSVDLDNQLTFHSKITEIEPTPEKPLKRKAEAIESPVAPATSKKPSAPSTNLAAAATGESTEGLSKAQKKKLAKKQKLDDGEGSAPAAAAPTKVEGKKDAKPAANGVKPSKVRK